MFETGQESRLQVIAEKYWVINQHRTKAERKYSILGVTGSSPVGRAKKQDTIEEIRWFLFLSGTSSGKSSGKFWVLRKISTPATVEKLHLQRKNPPMLFRRNGTKG